MGRSVIAGDNGPALVFESMHSEADWLSLTFETHHEQVKIVWSDVFEGSATFAVPIFSMNQRVIGESALPFVYTNRYLGTRSPLAFVTLKYVIFKDEGVWLSWCNNPGCHSFRSCNQLSETKFFNSSDYSHLNSAECISTDRRVCPCGQATMHCHTAAAGLTINDFSEALQAVGDVGEMPCSYVPVHCGLFSHRLHFSLYALCGLRLCGMRKSGQPRGRRNHPQVVAWGLAMLHSLCLSPSDLIIKLRLTIFSSFIIVLHQ